MIGNVAIEVELDPGRAAGAGRLRESRRPHPPRAGAQAAGTSAHAGTGTTARTTPRASAQGNVIGTYLHGPLLPKNAWFADWLIAAATGLPQPLPGSTTRWRRRRMPTPAGPPGSERVRRHDVPIARVTRLRGAVRRRARVRLRRGGQRQLGPARAVHGDVRHHDVDEHDTGNAPGDRQAADHVWATRTSPSSSCSVSSTSRRSRRRVTTSSSTATSAPPR